MVARLFRLSLPVTIMKYPSLQIFFVINGIPLITSHDRIVPDSTRQFLLFQ